MSQRIPPENAVQGVEETRAQSQQDAGQRYRQITGKQSAYQRTAHQRQQQR